MFEDAPCCSLQFSWWLPFPSFIPLAVPALNIPVFRFVCSVCVWLCSNCPSNTESSSEESLWKDGRVPQEELCPKIKLFRRQVVLYKWSALFKFPAELAQVISDKARLLSKLLELFAIGMGGKGIFLRSIRSLYLSRCNAGLGGTWQRRTNQSRSKFWNTKRSPFRIHGCRSSFSLVSYWRVVLVQSWNRKQADGTRWAGWSQSRGLLKGHHLVMRLVWQEILSPGDSFPMWLTVYTLVFDSALFWINLLQSKWPNVWDRSPGNRFPYNAD